jgi:tetratricopeptide (TPR) repeat protein
MGLCYLLTLYCAIRAAASPVSWRWDAAAVAACAAGMASKEVMVSAPLIVLLYDRVFLFPSLAEALVRRKGLYAGLAATWLLLLVLVVPSLTRSGSAGWGQGVSSWEYLLTQAGAIVRYLRLFIWPDPLVLDYGTAVVRQPSEIVPQALLVLLLLGATTWSWRRYAWAAFLGTWFFAVLAPSSSIVPILTQTAAEHRMYLPLAPLVTLAVVGGYLAWLRIVQPSAGAAGLLRARGGPAMAVASVALLLAVRTHSRNHDYRTQFAAWEATLRDWPSNQRPRLAMADRLMATGDVPRAIQKYTEALQRAPRDAAIYNSRGVACQKLGQYESAVADHTRAIELDPDWLAYNNRGVAHRYLGRFPEALEDHTKAIQLNPQSAQVWYSRGVVRRLAGQSDLALTDFTRAIELQPEMAEALHDRGALNQTAGNLEAALSDYTKALEVAPQNPLPWVNRGGLNQQLGRLQAAVDDYSRALALDPRDGPTYLSRAVCYLALERPELARSDLMAAQRLGISPDPAIISQLQNALQSRTGGTQ